MAEGNETDLGIPAESGISLSEFTQYVDNHFKKNPRKKRTQAAIAELLQKFKSEKAKGTSEEQKKEQEKELTESESSNYIKTLIAGEQQTVVADTTAVTGVPSRRVNINQTALDVGVAAASTARARRGESEYGYYEGAKLVDSKGNIARDPYSGDQDVEMLFREVGQNNVKLRSLLTTLQTHGYYSGSKPSELAMSGNGFETKDFNAAALFLEQANRKGLTWDAYLPAVEASAGTYSGGGGGGSFSSKEDIAVYLRSAGFKYLGRNLTKGEIDAAVKRIQQEQLSRTSSTGGEESTSLTTAAMGAAIGAAPEEYASYSLGAALDRIYAKLGGE